LQSIFLCFMSILHRASIDVITLPAHIRDNQFSAVRRRRRCGAAQFNTGCRGFLPELTGLWRARCTALANARLQRGGGVGGGSGADQAAEGPARWRPHPPLQRHRCARCLPPQWQCCAKRPPVGALHVLVLL
jgi:hypothetical protein